MPLMVIQDAALNSRFFQVAKISFFVANLGNWSRKEIKEKGK